MVSYEVRYWNAKRAEERALAERLEREGYFERQAEIQAQVREEFETRYPKPWSRYTVQEIDDACDWRNARIDELRQGLVS